MHTISLNRDDLIKQTHRWVFGACIEWNDHFQQFADTSSREFRDFVNRTHHIVFRFLRGQQTPAPIMTPSKVVAAKPASPAPARTSPSKR